MNGDFPRWVKVVAQVGFPIAVAVWLLTYASPRIAGTSDAMTQHQLETQQQTVLLRAICRNTAKTELQASFCDFGRTQP